MSAWELDFWDRIDVRLIGIAKGLGVEFKDK